MTEVIQKTEEEVFKEIVDEVSGLQKRLKDLGVEGSVMFMAHGIHTISLDSGLDHQSLINLTVLGLKNTLNHRERLEMEERKRQEATMPTKDQAIPDPENVSVSPLDPANNLND